MNHNRRLSIGEYWKPEKRALSHPLAHLSSLSSFIVKLARVLHDWTARGPALKASRNDVGSISQEFNKEPTRSLCSEQLCNVFSGKKSASPGRERGVGNSAAHYSCPSYSPSAITRVALNISSEYPAVEVYARLTLANIADETCAINTFVMKCRVDRT